MELVGVQIDNLICIEDLKYDRILCKCTVCGETCIKDKGRFANIYTGKLKDAHMMCNNKNCPSRLYKTKDKYSVGTIIGNYKIIRRIDYLTLETECIHCGKKEILTTQNIGKRKNCSNKLCSNYKKLPGETLYGKGDKVNNLEVLEFKEKGRYLVRCNVCGKVMLGRTAWFNDGKPHCTNVNCIKYARRPNSYIVGYIRNNLKCIEYVQVGTQLGIKLKCLICGEEYITKEIPDFLGSNLRCKNIKCKNCRTYDYSNEETDKVKVVDGSLSDYVLVECKVCGCRFKAKKQTITNGECSCRNKSCINYNNMRPAMVGKCYGEYTLFGFTDNCEYRVKCNICGKTDIRKFISSKSACRKHPRKAEFKNIKFNDFTMINYEYTYKDLDYFTCKCQKCGKRDILNVKQMLEHRCEGK